MSCAADFFDSLEVRAFVRFFLFWGFHVGRIRSCWDYVSTRKADWWIAAFTAGLALATAALAFATFALVGSTNQLANVEKEHGEEEWRRVVHATIGQLANATNASPARRLCARYVIAADEANGIRAEDAARLLAPGQRPRAVPMRCHLQY